MQNLSTVLYHVTLEDSVKWEDGKKTMGETFSIACVASVSVGLSAGLKHFSLLKRAKIGARAKKYEKGEGKGGNKTLARKPHDFEKPVRPRTELP